MALTISTSLLLLVVVVLLIRRGALKSWHALVCTLLGFHLATSSLAPSIRQVTASVTGMITDLHL